MADSLERLLRQYLNLYWLRPESAIWRAVDAMALANFHFQRPSADLGCGDGSNTYILMGGDFDLSFDDFLVTRPTTPEDFLAGRSDIYDFADSPDKSFPVFAPPQRQIDIGLDWKLNSLQKAETLGVYAKTVQHDFNNPLPFADGELMTVFSNAVYWVERVDKLLAEMRRVMAVDGRLLLLLPDESIKRYYIYDLYLKNGWDWAKNLDMGRHSHIKHHYSSSQWEETFRRAGLRIASHLPYLSHRVIQISEIGLRPLSPVLIKMANRLSPGDRQLIKGEWIEYCYRFIRPLFDSGWITEGEPTFHLFELMRH
ncbi:MAG: class I SAM-dependent methyltransferase [Chloroflexi bacterium]|nr:class I SAM-dependent methyltransferase [Chloroflexota bacterium]